MQWWCYSLDRVQLKGYFLVTLGSFQMRHYFSFLSCLHVFLGLKYPMDMQFGEDRFLDKISDVQQSHQEGLAVVPSSFWHCSPWGLLNFGCGAPVQWT